MSRIDPARMHVLRAGARGDGPVVYWMSRDQRAEGNWALLYAQEEAIRTAMPLGVVFCLVPAFLSAAARHYAFMLRGIIYSRLGETEADYLALAVEDFRHVLELTDDPDLTAFAQEYLDALGAAP